MDPAKSDFSAWIAILNCLGLALVALIVLILLSGTDFGPQSVAVSPEGVWVYGRKTLWSLTRRGDVTGRYSAAELGTGLNVDVLAPLDDAQIILHDKNSGRWRYCRFGRDGTVDVHSRPLFDGIEAGRNGDKAAVAIAPGHERWVFADFDRGDILLLDSRRQVRAEGKGLKNPDGGVAIWLPDQTLGLIATGHRTFHVSSLEGDRVAPLEKRLRLKDHGYVWSAAFDSQRGLWLLSFSSMRDGDRHLWEVDDTGAFTKRVLLDDDGQPAQIVMLDPNTALIPDLVTRYVHRLDLAGGNIDDFGDKSFRAALAHGQELYDHIGVAAGSVLVVLLLIPFIIAFYCTFRDMDRPLMAEQSLPPAAPLEGEFWFTPNPARKGFLRRLACGGGAAVLVLGIGEAWLFNYATGSYHWFILLLWPGLGAIFSVERLVAAWKEQKTKLGIRDNLVLYDGGQGKIEAYPLTVVLSDGMCLCVGSHKVVFKGLISSMWNAEEVRAHLLSRLPSENRVSSSILRLEMRKRCAYPVYSMPPPALIEGALWFTPNPEWLKRMFPVIWIGTPAWLGFAMFIGLPRAKHGGFSLPGKLVYSVLLPTLFVLIPYCAWQWRWAKKRSGTCRLGLKDDTVLYDHGSGRLQEHPLETVLTDGNQVLVGRHKLRLSPRGDAPLMWNPEELRAFLLPRLPSKNIVSSSCLQREAWRRIQSLLASAVKQLLPGRKR